MKDRRLAAFRDLLRAVAPRLLPKQIFEEHDLAKVTVQCHFQPPRSRFLYRPRSPFKVNFGARHQDLLEKATLEDRIDLGNIKLILKNDLGNLARASFLKHVTLARASFRHHLALELPAGLIFRAS